MGIAMIVVVLESGRARTDELNDKMRRLTLLTTASTQSLSVRELLDSVLIQVVESLSATHGLIRLIEGGGPAAQLVVRASVGFSESFLNECAQLPLTEPWLAKLFHEGSSDFLRLYPETDRDIWPSVAEPAVREMVTIVLRGKSGRNLLQVLLMMSGFWLTQNIITIFMPTGLLVRTLHLSGFQMSLTLLLSYFVLFFSYIGSGMLGQKIGRRTFFVVVGPLIATVGAVILYVLSNVDGLSLPVIMLLVMLLSVLVTSPWGVIVTYINERFVTDVRATGFGVGFSLSVIIPSFYAFYMNWLGAFMPLRLTPVVLLCIGGVIGTIGALMGPETKHVDF